MKKLKNLKKNKKGFTLIEMIVVIVIIAILAAIAVPAVMKYIDEARETKLITHASSAKTSLEAELAKYQAKNVNGTFTVSGDDSNLKAAVTEVAKEVTDVKGIAICTTVANSACTSPTADSTIKDIKGYVVQLETNKFVLIENDGASEVLKEATGTIVQPTAVTPAPNPAG